MILSGGKTLEIRKWKPEKLPLPDLLIIQNSKRLSSGGISEDPNGEAVALVDVESVGEWKEEELGAACGESWESGWLAWKITNVRPVKIEGLIPAKLRIYEVEALVKNESRTTVLIGGVEKRKIVIVDYDDHWPQKYEEHAKVILSALKDRLLMIEHVGSTSVPGLAAKPIIDIDVIVEDSSDEPAYLPLLEAAGYELRVREPDWHGHRMMRTPELDVHIHIFSPECPEVKRHLLFRNRLRKDGDDRQLYESTKRNLANQSWGDMNSYAEAKSEVVERIILNARKSA